MIKTVTFTRHSLTPQQIAERDAEIADWTENLFQPLHADYTALASETVTTMERAEEIAKVIMSGWQSCDAILVFGVLPSPVRMCLRKLSTDIEVYVYEAWNVNRAPEGEKPQFEFKGWLLTQAM